MTYNPPAPRDSTSAAQPSTGPERQGDSARQLQQMMDATTDAIFHLDRDYNFTFLNRRARELLAPSGDVFGKNLWTAFPGTVYPGSPYVSTYRRAMDERIPGSFEAFYPEPLNVC